MGRKWVRWARMAAMAEVLVSVHAQPQHSRNPLANHAVCVHVRACVCASRTHALEEGHKLRVRKNLRDGRGEEVMRRETRVEQGFRGHIWCSYASSPSHAQQPQRAQNKNTLALENSKSVTFFIATSCKHASKQGVFEGQRGQQVWVSLLPFLQSPPTKLDAVQMNCCCLASPAVCCEERWCAPSTTLPCHRTRPARLAAACCTPLKTPCDSRHPGFHRGPAVLLCAT
eukprot:799569-Pelagomonas_calceolata.AAC.2